MRCCFSLSSLNTFISFHLFAECAENINLSDRMTINEIIFQIFLKTNMEKELVSVHELAKNSRLLVLDKGY